MAEKVSNSYVLVYLYDESGTPYGLQYRRLTDTDYLTYYYQYNSKGDITGMYDSTGALVVTYTYDPWGKVLSVSDSTSNAIGYSNPWRYKGYYYDIDTGLYYLQTRYYDPETGRFINADGQLNTDDGLNGFNLYGYCGNNPVNRIDPTGEAFETVFDVVSLGISIVEVSVNPADPWAWAGLVCDTLDLIPFVTGAGEIVKGVKLATKSLDDSSDVLKAARKMYSNLDVSSNIRKATGTYAIQYKSGYSYVGKGGVLRALESAKRNFVEYGDDVTSIKWISAPNEKTAFIHEYLMQEKFGGVLKSNPKLRTYNKIWSPGKRLLDELLNK